MAYFPFIFFSDSPLNYVRVSKVFLEVWARKMWSSRQGRVTPLEPLVPFQSRYRTEAPGWVTVWQSPPLPQLFHRISASQSRAPPPPCLYGLHPALAQGFSTRCNWWQWWQSQWWQSQWWHKGSLKGGAGPWEATVGALGGRGAGLGSILRCLEQLGGIQLI